MITKTYFNVEVGDFLQYGEKPFLAQCWLQDMKKTFAEYVETAEWFSRNIPSNENQFWFNTLVAHTIVTEKPIVWKQD